MWYADQTVLRLIKNQTQLIKLLFTLKHFWNALVCTTSPIKILACNQTFVRLCPLIFRRSEFKVTCFQCIYRLLCSFLCRLSQSFFSSFYFWLKFFSSCFVFPQTRLLLSMLCDGSAEESYVRAQNFNQDYTDYVWCNIRIILRRSK